MTHILLHPVVYINIDNTVTWRLKAGIAEQKEAGVAKQRRGKQVSAATAKYATIDDVVFSMRSASRIQDQDKMSVSESSDYKI
jgi:hypothetical protein